MRKKVLKSLVATMLITSMLSVNVTVFADEITDLKNKQSSVKTKLEKTQNEMSYLLVQMDKLEVSIADKRTEIENAEAELAEAESKMAEQYAEMKLRIKYMYEEQSSSISDVLLGAENMSDMLNKAEYMQQVYDYDRSRLDDMAVMASQIADIKTSLEEDMASLEQMASDFTNKQALLYSTIDSLKKEYAEYDDKIEEAVEKAAARAAAEAANQNNSNVTIPTNANNDSAIASAVVALAHKFLGVPYVYGGSSPSGFDCSGFTSYLYRQFGITVSRSSSAQTRGGAPVNGLANALPGDIICYPGHVALYIGNGQVIHAPYPGQKVRFGSATMMTIISIRRYW